MIVIAGIILYLVSGIIILSYFWALGEGELPMDVFILSILTCWGWPIFMWILMPKIVLWKKK